MRKSVGLAFLVCAAIGFGRSARADVITFESGFTDQQAVGSVATATNNVTFGVGPGSSPTASAYIAKVGNPTTAFSTRDTPADLSVSGQFFLTDEINGPDLAYNYFIKFDIPVLNLGLDLYDYRQDGGPRIGDTATLTVYSDLARTMVVGTSVYTIPRPNPENGNIAQLSVLDPTAPILAASIVFSRPDVGTGIDNIRFQTTPEPSTLALAGIGIAGAGIGLRHRRRGRNA